VKRGRPVGICVPERLEVRLRREGLHRLRDAEERRPVEAAGRDGGRLLSIAGLCVPPAW
jgi:hypothetical protein